jgi:hypothetical protein
MSVTIADVAGLVAALAAGGGVWVAWNQLGRLADSNESAARSAESAAKSAESAAVANVIQIDTLRREAALRLEEAGLAVANLKTRKEAGETITEHEVTVADLRLNGAIDNYLNALDRICSFLRKGALPEDEYRPDYREIINEAIAKYESRFGGAQNHFRNVKAIYDSWREK